MDSCSDSVCQFFSCSKLLINKINNHLCLNVEILIYWGKTADLACKWPVFMKV